MERRKRTKQRRIASPALATVVSISINRSQFLDGGVGHKRTRAVVYPGQRPDVLLGRDTSSFWDLKVEFNLTLKLKP